MSTSGASRRVRHRADRVQASVGAREDLCPHCRRESLAVVRFRAAFHVVGEHRHVPMTKSGPGRSYTNAYFSYILIRIKGSGSCSRAGENGEFTLIPNRSGIVAVGPARGHAGGWVRGVLPMMRQSTASMASDKAGINGISLPERGLSPQTAREASMSISQDIGRRPIGGESRSAAAAGDAHNFVLVYTHGPVRESRGKT